MRCSRHDPAQNGPKPPVDAQGALQIDRATGFEAPDIGPVEAFREQIKHELALALGGDREAAAIDGDTLPYAHPRGRAGALDEQLRGAVRAAQPDNFTNFAN